MRITHLLAIAAALLTGNSAALAAHSVSVGAASAPLRSEATLRLAYKADAAEAAGMQVNIPLPEGTSYIAESLNPNPHRLAGMEATASVRGGELVIVLYSAGRNTIAAGEGDILTLRLRTGKEPGVFALTPRIKLSDAAGKAIDCTAIPGSLTALAPALEFSPAVLDFGRVPIRGTYTRTVTLTNTGTEPVAVSDIAAEGLPATFTPAGLSIEPGQAADVTVTYSPVDYADGIEATATVASNDYRGARSFAVRAVPYSVNILRLLRGEADGGSEATVALALQNMEPIVGADFEVELPEEFSYVAGSIEAAPRAAAMSATASQNGRKVRVVLYNAANRPVEGNDGELCSFRVKVNARSGWFSLTPAKVRLANAAGRDMTSGVEGEYMVVRSPQISTSARAQFGNRPCTEDAVLEHTVYNYGDGVLTLTRAIFADRNVELEESLPISVEPYGSTTLHLRPAANTPGAFATTMNLYSNDPVTPLVTIGVDGNIYSPNELSFSGKFSRTDEYVLSGALENNDRITAMQMDIELPRGVTLDPDGLELSGRRDGHSATLAQLPDGKWRLIIYSASNKPFRDSEGTLFSLKVKGTGLRGATARLSNIKVTDATGANLTTPGTDTNTHTLAGRLVGDLNDDGVVNVTDVTMMVAVSQGTIDPSLHLEVGDLNGDGNIDIMDVTMHVSLFMSY